MLMFFGSCMCDPFSFVASANIPHYFLVHHHFRLFMLYGFHHDAKHP